MEATPHKKFHEILTEEMQRRGLTDGSVAKKLDVSRVSILRHRSGETMPPLSLGMAYARLLRIPAARLLQSAAIQGGE